MRHERNGPKGNQDGVSTKDFSSATEMKTLSSMNPSKLSLMTPETFSIRNHSKFSLMTQPADIGTDTPKSRRLLKFGHGRKKSQNMNFEMSIFGITEKEKSKERAKQKHPVFTLTRSLARWKRLYRSHSSDLRRFRAEHRSSVSKEAKAEFLELEILPGFDGGWESIGRAKMEQWVISRRRAGNRRVGEGESTKFKGREGGPLIKEKSTDLLRGRITEVDNESGGESDIDARAEGASTIERSSFSARTGQHSPISTRAGNGVEKLEGDNPCAEIYQDCLVKDDNDDSDLDPASSILTLPAVDQTTVEKQSNGNVRHFSGSSEANRQGEPSYISCSVGMLSEDVNDDIFIRECRDRNTNNINLAALGTSAIAGAHSYDGTDGSGLLSLGTNAGERR